MNHLTIFAGWTSEGFGLNDLTLIFIFFVFPILVIFSLVLIFRKVLSFFRGDESSWTDNSNNSTQINDQQINWKSTEQSKQKEKMPAWQILLIVIGSCIGLYYTLAIIVGIGTQLNR